MRLLDLYEIFNTFSFASILPPDFKLKLGGQSQPQQAVSPALTLRERGDFGSRVNGLPARLSWAEMSWEVLRKAQRK